MVANLLLDLTVGIAFEAAIDGMVHLFTHDGAAPKRYAEVVIIAVEPDFDRLCRSLTGREAHMFDSDGIAWLIDNAGSDPSARAGMTP